MRWRKIVAILMLVMIVDIADITGVSIGSSQVEAAVKSRKKTTRNVKKRKSKTGKKTNKNKRNKRNKRQTLPRITVVKNDTATGEWIHRGRKNIVIHRDTAGVVRAMAPFSSGVTVGKPYADVINRYAETLAPSGVRVYSLLTPTQGEFYMPEEITDNRSQSNVIEKFTAYLNDKVTPVMVSDTLRCHRNEEIYNRTDHHWSPLGAYYASAVLAKTCERPFMGLDSYTTDTVRNYVGTMYKFSGDREILKYPEEFIYYVPSGDYYAEFIDYAVSGKRGGESEKHQAPVFRKFPDGSGAAYSTFLGGDNHTVRIVNRNDTSKRKVLLVKDSFGNAMAPCLINSFEEVHVIDFRYFPHNLIDYVHENGITDLVFENCIELAFAPNTTQRLEWMRNVGKTGHSGYEPDNDLISATDSDIDENSEDDSEDDEETEDATDTEND